MIECGTRAVLAACFGPENEVDDPSDVQTAQEMRGRGQRAQPLLHHRGDQKLGAGTVDGNEPGR